MHIRIAASMSAFPMHSAAAVWFRRLFLPSAMDNGLSRDSHLAQPPGGATWLSDIPHTMPIMHALPTPHALPMLHTLPMPVMPAYDAYPKLYLYF